MQPEEDQAGPGLPDDDADDSLVDWAVLRHKTPWVRGMGLATAAGETRRFLGPTERQGSANLGDSSNEEYEAAVMGDPPPADAMASTSTVRFADEHPSVQSNIGAQHSTAPSTTASRWEGLDLEPSELLEQPGAVEEYYQQKQVEAEQRLVIDDELYDEFDSDTSSDDELRSTHAGELALNRYGSRPNSPTGASSDLQEEESLADSQAAEFVKKLLTSPQTSPARKGKKAAASPSSSKSMTSWEQFEALSATWSQQQPAAKQRTAPASLRAVSPSCFVQLPHKDLKQLEYLGFRTALRLARLNKGSTIAYLPGQPGRRQIKSLMKHDAMAPTASLEHASGSGGAPLEGEGLEGAPWQFLTLDQKEMRRRYIQRKREFRKRRLQFAEQRQKAAALAEKAEKSVEVNTSMVMYKDRGASFGLMLTRAAPTHKVWAPAALQCSGFVHTSLGPAMTCLALHFIASHRNTMCLRGMTWAPSRRDMTICPSEFEAAMQSIGPMKRHSECAQPSALSDELSS